MGYNNETSKSSESVVYVTVVGMKEGEIDHDWRVEKSGPSTFKVTNLETSETSDVDLSSFDYSHNSLIKMQGGSQVG